MLDVNAFNSHVAARILDFCQSATQWHRRLWSLGLSLTLSEILEASEACQTGTLSSESLKTLATSVMALAGPDPGTGDDAQKQLLQQVLKSDLNFWGLDYYTVRDISIDIQRNYLIRLANAVEQPNHTLRPERLARAICTHLLDTGFSPDYLHRWWTYKTRHEGHNRKLHELIAEAHQLVSTPPSRFDILIAFEEVPKTTSLPQRWLDAPSVSSWIRSHGFDNSQVRQKGGMLITETARDATSAVERVAETLETLAARVAVAVKGVFRPIPIVWVAGYKTPFELGLKRRAVQIHSLHREGQIFSDRASQVDAAIELIAPLSSSSPAAAVAGGWAAIEALLSESNDRGSAASRMASIVACSYIRAELTPMSFTVEKAGGAIAEKLNGASKNRDRCEILAAAILNNEPLPLQNQSDIAARSRMSSLLAAPHLKLRDLETHLCAAFRRLYRQRNLVLHGGKTNAVALRACLRTVAPLVGAGMDRIAHAWFVENIGPLELAARARIRLSLLRPGDGIRCVDLLSQ